METESRIKELTVTGTEVVVQHNNLIDSVKMINLQEQKLFLFLISKLNPDNPEDITFRISIDEFAKAIGINNTKNTYRDVRNAVKRLMNNIITIHGIENGHKTTTDIPILGYAKYWHGLGYADIKISNEIAPYLFHLHREFTQYKLSQITSLSSVYAIRLYEMLKKQEDFKQRQFFLDDLRKKLNIEPKKYKGFKDFRVYVLEIAKREINLKTDISIDFEYIKSGRKIVAIKFNIKPKRSQADRNVSVTEDFKVIQDLKKLGFSYPEASSMVYSIETCEAVDAINAVKDQVRKGNAKNPKAMAITAFRERWFASEEETTVKKKKKTKERVDKEAMNTADQLKTKIDKEQNQPSNQNGFVSKLRKFFKG